MNKVTAECESPKSINVAMTVRMIICRCRCTMCERHLALFVFFFKLILALWRGARLHSCRVPPEGSGLQRSIRSNNAELSLSRQHSCLSLCGQCQVESQSLKHVQTKVISNSAVLEVIHGRMDSTHS